MKQKFKQLFKSDIAWILLIAIVTAISGQVRLSPFSGENFRFGIGTITFLFMLLIRQPKKYFLTGVISAIVLIAFRVSVDLLFYDGQFTSAIHEHFPSGAFYIVYSVGFHLLHVSKYKERPIILGLLATLNEGIGNSVEHLLRILLFPEIVYDGNAWFLLIAVAFLRSFFVVGLFSTITLAEQKKRLEEQLTVESDLYIETLYLKKSMNHTEQIMSESYELYRSLKEKNDKELAIKALHIAQEIHEVKKDTQRIFSGLSDISLIKENEEGFKLSQLMEMSTSSNMKYAEHINRQVVISWTAEFDFKVKEHMLLLAIINNIVSNAVESIPKEGKVKIKVQGTQEVVSFEISDTGQGIGSDDLTLIYEAGFTTKYSEKGVAATGIGLSHVKEAVRFLNGDILVESSENGTLFRIDIPWDRLEQGGTF